MKTLLAICILLYTNMVSAWSYSSKTDPFTDVTTPTITLGNMVAWCQPKAAFAWHHPVVIILTDATPQPHVVRSSLGTYAEVTFEYRFDKEKSRKGTIGMASDYTGIRLCPGRGKMCAKQFLQRAYAANTLRYRIDTYNGHEAREVDLTLGRENLRKIMDSCKIKPKTFAGIGDAT